MEAMVASVEQPDGMGVRLLRFRQLVGYTHGAVTFLRVSAEDTTAPVLEIAA